MGGYIRIMIWRIFFFQAEDGIRDAQESRGLGDVYKRHRILFRTTLCKFYSNKVQFLIQVNIIKSVFVVWSICLLYTSDAADDLLCVDLGGRRIINKKNTKLMHT